jgi:ATPase components of ABC transporters with duplicated ATPase domains
MNGEYKMNLLTAEKITKSFTDKLLFDNTDFSINEGDKIGVIGVNGTGKTTLLKMISGLEENDTGTISKKNNLQIRFLHQTPVFEENTTVLAAVLKENINKLNEWTIESDAKSMLHKLGIVDFEQPVSELSGGQKRRVSLANVLLAPADILILDEPTNHLDNHMAEWLEAYLKKFTGSLVMVTHDRYFLDRVSNRIIEIDRGKIYSYSGNYSEFVRLKEARQNSEIASERKRQSLLKTELEWLARGARARSTKQKAHIARVEALRDQKGIEQESQVQMSSISSRLGRKTIEVDSIGKSYGEKLLFQDYSYIFLKGERIGIVGPNGSGKSTLLKIINGVVEADTGIVDIGQTVKLGYFSQENEYMDHSQKVIDYIKDKGEYVKTKDGIITASQMLERFLFEGAVQYSKIEKLSGGERRRLYLLSILMEAPNVLILDEPTNDLDIQTLTILEDYLDGFDGIVIVVSHDRYFLDRIVSRIFSFEEGKIKQYEGGFSDYLAASEAHMRSQDIEIKIEKTTTDTRKNREVKLKFTFQEQKEYEVIEQLVADLEVKIEELQAAIDRSATDYGKLNELMEEKNRVEQELEEKMERWMYLNELAEQIEGQSKK